MRWLSNFAISYDHCCLLVKLYIQFKHSKNTILLLIEKEMIGLRSVKPCTLLYARFYILFIGYPVPPHRISYIQHCCSYLDSSFKWPPPYVNHMYSCSSFCARMLQHSTGTPVFLVDNVWIYTLKPIQLLWKNNYIIHTYLRNMPYLLKW